MTTTATHGNGPGVIGVLDGRLHVVQISHDVVDVLDRASADLIGRSLLDVVHRDEHAELLVTFGSVLATRSSASIRLRIRNGDGRWLLVRATLAVLAGTGDQQLAFVLEPTGESEAEVRVDLLDRLRRIALEVRASGVIEAPDAASRLAMLPGSEALSDRQREILALVLDGVRVPSIARDMHLSPSTVRNHLGAIYKRLGVASQVELLELARATRRP